jgi:hypothetical protein
VPGDVVKLSAGDMIPGDVRLIAAKDLFIIQATLTGESLPVEKHDARTRALAFRPLSTRTSASSARASRAARHGVIVATGAQTYFGKMASSLSGQQVETRRSTKASKNSLAHDPFMLVMVPMVFLINGFMKHNWKDAFFLRDGRGRRPHAGNAADDRFRLPFQGRAGDVQEKSHRQAPELHPELRRDGRALHGQDRHADD